MSNEQKKIVPIDYTHRDFSSIKEDLVQIAERFYPDNFQDFSEASFGSLMLDAVAYVGDQLSFYIDYNVNESFLDTAYQYNNVLRHGRALGYKYTGRPSTYGKVALYVLVPASAAGLGPDTDYIPILKRGSRFTSENALNFVLIENVDFADPKNPVVVARVDGTTGAPTFYAIKAYGNVVSGYFGQEQITVGAFERFMKVKLKNSNITEIISVMDTQGNEFFEVDYLSQDIVFKEIPNNNFKEDNVPSVIKPYLVSRKFVIERNKNKTFLQFGSGKTGETNVVAEPQSVALDIFGKDYVTDMTFDPTRLSRNENLGIVPSNTTLTVVYRVTNPTNSNAAVGSLNTVSHAISEFKNRDLLVSSTAQGVIASVEVINEEPIVGDVTMASTTELKRRVYDTFPTQNRAVTQADYENVAYRLPPKFGSVKRCSVQKDPDSLKRNLNMYVVSENQFGKLTKTNSTIKNNLKTWLNHYRMINDTIDILDPYILNLGIEFIVQPTAAVDKFSLLNACVKKLEKKFSPTFYIGEHFFISDVYQELKNVEGVLDVLKVKLVNKTGTNYSGVQLDINSNLSPDGSYLIIPKNVILEIKYPQTDIKGKIR
ncbi:hypothetical protein CMI47_10370 [Candidatus Pacearchaeota archaeon]|nr:hypothetical protein [Candidatus Pacearchaeota archaeon]|tara:strand:- start:2972 stop:4768 length:1797 start_codon:yes stop_codon:yes gene_type:complete